MNEITQSVVERIGALRDEMQQNGWDAFIVPSNDPHNSEYTADYWTTRAYISGFTGSAGTCVITRDRAALWTDGRYFVQAASELDGTDIQLMKQGAEGVPDMMSWLSDMLSDGSRVAITGQVCMQAAYEQYVSTLKDKGVEVVLCDDPFERTWASRPALGSTPVIRHDDTLAGRTAGDKMNDIRARMRTEGAEALVVSALDEIGWLLNLRGYDVDFNPVFYAYFLLYLDRATLYVHEGKIGEDVAPYLGGLGIMIANYDHISADLQDLQDGSVIWADAQQTNAALWQAFHHKDIHRSDSPIKWAKAIKNDTEIKHLRGVMIKDGVALFRAKRRLDQTLAAGQQMSEYFMGEVVAAERAKMPHYYGESFNAIVGYKANGAIIHYRAPEEGSAMIDAEGILLLDSGGQYHDGTSDITRTWALGEATDRQKLHYTLVLKGHIALAMAKFPDGTTGVQLDTLARQHLWQYMCNYNHGTGHGVGFFMNVHEPPQGFRPDTTERGLTVLEPGMYTSNEPGYYETGAYGIRLENLVICVKADEEGRWLRHETITLYPFDHALIDTALLTHTEVSWLNSYHRKVRTMLSPHLDPEELIELERQCAPIDI